MRLENKFYQEEEKDTSTSVISANFWPLRLMSSLEREDKTKSIKVNSNFQC